MENELIMSQKGSAEHSLIVLFWRDFKGLISFLIQQTATPFEVANNFLF